MCAFLHWNKVSDESFCTVNESIMVYNVYRDRDKWEKGEERHNWDTAFLHSHKDCDSKRVSLAAYTVNTDHTNKNISTQFHSNTFSVIRLNMGGCCFICSAIHAQTSVVLDKDSRKSTIILPTQLWPPHWYRQILENVAHAHIQSSCVGPEESTCLRWSSVTCGLRGWCNSCWPRACLANGGSQRSSVEEETHSSNRTPFWTSGCWVDTTNQRETCMRRTIATKHKSQQQVMLCVL